ncbi:MAG TPA: hypothetical protein VL172_22555 [Kofleriaceae bacterium]|nr:hypothetical protein [Kofleriaceae bacterium]
MGTAQTRLCEALKGSTDQMVARWLEQYRASSTRLPGSFDERAMSQLARPVFESLAEVLPAAELHPGTHELREVEKTVSFIGSSLAGAGGSGFDTAALVQAARDVVLDHLDDEAEQRRFSTWFDWLLALAMDAFGASGANGAKERLREQLENGMPAVVVAPEVPAAFLVGDPDTLLLDAFLGRVLMLIVRVGGKVVILDASGLTDPASPAMVVGLDRFFRHRKMAGVAVLAVGLDGKAREAWTGLAGRADLRLAVHESFDQAVADALERTGQRLLRRSS